MLYYCVVKLSKGLHDIFHAVLSIIGLWSFLFLAGVNVVVHPKLKDFSFTVEILLVLVNGFTRPAERSCHLGVAFLGESRLLPQTALNATQSLSLILQEMMF